LLEEFDRSARVTEDLIMALPRRLWRAELLAGSRSIAAIVTHMQGVRRTFAKMGGMEPAPPALDRLQSTQAQARRAFEQSRKALLSLFVKSLAQGEARVKGMPRRTVNMMLYLIQHDTHHRGQICLVARALGHRLAKDDITRMWGWRKLP
jgi:uncharacterized damage-inducible protein DinB